MGYRVPASNHAHFNARFAAGHTIALNGARDEFPIPLYIISGANTHAYSVHVPMCGCMSISSVTQELNVDVTGLELSPAAAQCAVLRLEQLAVNKVSGCRSLQ